MGHDHAQHQHDSGPYAASRADAGDKGHAVVHTLR